MKFKLFIITILLIATACVKEKDIQIITSEKSEDIYKEDEPKYVDDNPITVGIYENGINLIKDFKMIKQSRNEVVFCLFYTNEEELGHNSQKENWYNFYSKYTNIDDYKIGFHFSFYVGETKMEKTILHPYTFAFEPYFYIYLYDDINQPDNTFYSHLEDDDINDNTIFSSIKIFLMDPEEITSPIKFTVFTYNGLEDFDESNNYRGNSKYEINIDLV